MGKRQIIQIAEPLEAKLPNRSVAMAYSRLGRTVSDIAFAAVARRFEKTRSLLAALEWSSLGGSGYAVGTSVVSSTGFGAYEVRLRMIKGAVSVGYDKSGEKMIWEEGGDNGWKCYSKCGCGFFAEDYSSGLCKHAGALAQFAGEFALALAEALAIKSSLGKGNIGALESTGGQTPMPKPRL